MEELLLAGLGAVLGTLLSIPVSVWITRRYARKSSAELNVIADKLHREELTSRRELGYGIKRLIGHLIERASGEGEFDLSYDPDTEEWVAKYGKMEIRSMDATKAVDVLYYEIWEEEQRQKQTDAAAAEPEARWDSDSIAGD